MEVIASRYEVLATVRREVGRTLLRAHDRQLDHAVALKIIDLTDDDARRDLLDEARMLVKLPPHPSLPTMRGDFAIDETQHAIVMDWIEGQNLAELLEAKGTPGLPAADVAVYVTQAAAALDHLHANLPPIVHGDVKPSNLLITAAGRVVLVDFGIARPAGARVDAGTRGFVAPEVPRGDPTTPAVDVYGLAATACALLTGSPPAPGVLDLVHVDPVVAVPLASALKSGLATRPDRRPPSAGALADRISAAQRALPAGMVTFLSLELVASVYLWDSDDGDLVATRERLDDQVLAIIEDHAGRAIPSDTDPNRLLVVFTSVTAAAATALAVHAHLARARWSAGVVIRARAGLHTGEAEVRAGRYSGGVVARAGRLRTAARPGDTRVSSSTAGLLLEALPAAARVARHETADGDTVFLLLRDVDSDPWPDAAAEDRVTAPIARPAAVTPPPARAPAAAAVPAADGAVPSAPVRPAALDVTEPTSSSTALDGLTRSKALFESLADLALRAEQRRRERTDDVGAEDFARAAEPFARRAIALDHEIADLDRP